MFWPEIRPLRSLTKDSSFWDDRKISPVHARGKNDVIAITKRSKSDVIAIEKNIKNDVIAIDRKRVKMASLLLTEKEVNMRYWYCYWKIS